MKLYVIVVEDAAETPEGTPEWAAALQGDETETVWRHARRTCSRAIPRTAEAAAKHECTKGDSLKTVVIPRRAGSGETTVFAGEVDDAESWVEGLEQVTLADVQALLPAS